MWGMVHISISEYSYKVHVTRGFSLISVNSYIFLLSVPRYTCTCMQSLKKIKLYVWVFTYINIHLCDLAIVWFETTL